MAHNITFDLLMMNIELARQEATPIETPGKRFCTMTAMTPICKLQGNYGDYKWPKLSEAYEHAFQEKLEGAHDAMADVRGCARIYRWLKDQKPQETTTS